MLRKLLRYEFAALSRVLAPILLLLPLLGVAELGVYAILRYVPDGSGLSIAMKISMGLLYGAFILAICSAFAIALFLILQRYYKSMFSDEAYLTFSLPVPRQTLLDAKILSGLIWCAFALLSIAISLAIALSPFFSDTIVLLSDLGEVLSEFFTQLPFYLTGNVLTFIMQGATSLLLFYTAITIGSLLFVRHRIFGSILFYIAINMAVSFLSTLFSLITEIYSSGFYVDGAAPRWAVYLPTLLNFLFYVALFAGFYFLIRHLITKKLNLE